MWCVYVVCVCVLSTSMMWSVAAQAADTSDLGEEAGKKELAVLVISVSAECATLDAKRTLKDEMALRLPSVVSLAQEKPTSGPVWHVFWRFEPKMKECQIVLEDTERVVAIPLSAHADVVQIREAVVRIAWFLSTSKARQKVHIVSQKGVPQKGVPKKMAKVNTNAALHTDAAYKEMVISTKPFKTAPGDEGVAAAVLARVATGLDAWEDDSPEHIPTDHVFSSNTMVLELLGDKVPVEVHLSMVGNVLGAYSSSFALAGVQLGVQFARRVGLGLYSFYGQKFEDDSFLIQSVSGDVDVTQMVWSTVHREFILGGVSLEYVFWSGNNLFLHDWFVSANLGLGGGVLFSFSPLGGAYSIDLLSGDVAGQFMVSIFPWLHFGLGVGYRAMMGWNTPNVIWDDLSSPFGSVLFRVDVL